VGRVSNNISDTKAADTARAEELIGQALAVLPGYPVTRYAKGFLLATQNRRAEAIPEFEAVVASDRNWAAAIAQLGRCRFVAGSTEEMIPAQEQAIRLSPRDPLIYGWCHWIGQAHLLQSRTDEAIVWIEKARSANPAFPGVHGWLASAYALKGESERAAAELAEARRLNADDRYSNIARLQAVGYWGVPKIRALFETTYFAGLCKAGMPKE
jgi:tetratricopeptide (TPR) repeat protein